MTLPTAMHTQKCKKYHHGFKIFFLLPLNQYQCLSRKNGPFTIFVVLTLKNTILNTQTVSTVRSEQTAVVYEYFINI